MSKRKETEKLILADKIIARVVFAVIGLVVLQWFVARTGSFLSWVFISLVLSFAIEPFVNSLEHNGWRRGASTGLAMFGLVVLSTVLVLSIVPVVTSQISDLINNIPDWANDIETAIEDRFDVDVSSETLIEQAEQANINVSDFAGNITSNLLGISTQVFVAIFQILTIGLFTFYFVADGPKFRRSVCSLMPKGKQEVFLETWETAIDKTGAYFYSRLLMALISAVATFLVLSLIGVPYALSLAIWVGFVSQFIPTVGTYIASALPLAVAALDEPVKAIYVLIFIIVYQQIENYFIGPQITAKTMQLHPAVALGSAIIGANLGGAIGAILALPVASVIQVSAGRYVKRYDVIDSKLVRSKKTA